ncbi:hypothetical protein C2S51_010766 [Perilla frutescens var. frutescens]|nr:hypothetical protein C2S51_010766 [Perilla frutescens var. frutescens]
MQKVHLSRLSSPSAAPPKGLYSSPAWSPAPGLAQLSFIPPYNSQENSVLSIFNTCHGMHALRFDGVDLDWDSPENPTEMQNLGYLLEEWRAEVEKEAAATGRPPLLLTAAVYYSADTFAYGPQRAYPAASIRKNLDWVNIMSYDYRGAWDITATGAHAALFDPNTNISTSSGLQSWIRVGVPPSKLIVGLPLYGRTWQLRDPGLHGVGAPAVGVGPGGDIGVMTYAEVVKFNRENKAMIVCDESTVSVYAVAGNDWVGYDDQWSVRKKIEYARNLGLGGYFFWQVTGDYEWDISKTGKDRIISICRLYSQYN